MAAVLAEGGHAVLSHSTALGVWELEPPRALVEVTLPHPRRSRPGIRTHSAVLADDEITVERGLAVTTVPRTLFDVAATVRPRQFERLINQAEVRRMADPLSLDDLLARHPRRRGAATVRVALAASRIGLEVTRSELEERFLAFVASTGLSRPELNAPLTVGGRSIEVDCLWRRERLIVELDGRAVHATGAAFERDRARDRALMASSWRVVRVTWQQLHHGSAALACDLRSLLAAGV